MSSPLVLLHGFTSTARVWEPVLPALSEHHDVFTPTLPGHLGGDPWPDHEELSIEGIADALERTLDARGIERAHIAGNSLGGWLAMELAARGRALSTVALCPAGGWEPGTKVERAILRFFRQNELMLRYTGPAMLRFAASRPRLRHLMLRELMSRPGNVNATAALAMFEGAAGCTVLSAMLALADSGKAFGELEGIDSPLRIAYGTDDRLLRWPSAYPRLRQMLPDADWVALEGLGHIPMWDDPDATVQTILEVTAAEAEVPA